MADTHGRRKVTIALTRDQMAVLIAKWEGWEDMGRARTYVDEGVSDEEMQDPIDKLIEEEFESSGLYIETETGSDSVFEIDFMEMG